MSAIFISLCITETLISIQHCAPCLITTKSSKEPSKKNTIISTLQVRKLRCGDLKRLLKVTPRVDDKVWCSIQICDSQSHALPTKPYCFPEKCLKCIFIEEVRLKNDSAVHVRNGVRLPGNVSLNLGS